MGTTGIMTNDTISEERLEQLYKWGYGSSMCEFCALIDAYRERTPPESAVQLVRDCGLATGHADDWMSLLREVLEQVENIRRERDILRRERDILRARLAEYEQRRYNES